MAKVRFKAVGKVLLVIFALPLVIFGTTKIKDSLKKPSQEILRLRQIEANLGLPESPWRHEEDTGCNRSPLGTISYSRYITRYYGDEQTPNQVKNILEFNGWNLKMSNSFEGDMNYTYINEAQNASVYINIESKPSANDTRPHHVTIQSLNEDKCESIP